MIDAPIPKLRDDLLYKSFDIKGNEFYIVYDEIGLINQTIAFSQSELEIFKLLDGINTIENIVKKLNYEEEKTNEVLSFINLLAASLFLENEAYFNKRRNIENYLKSNVKDSVCNGTTYPDDPNELKKYLEYILNASSKTNDKYDVILAPHLDFRTGKNTHLTYSKAFNSIDYNNIEFVVLFGTAHYRSTNDFMFTKKNYKTPFGEIKTDEEFLRLLESNCKSDIHYDDLAHLNEHSLELHIIFLQYLLPTNIKILPVLIGSPYEYLQNGYPDENNYYSNVISAFQKSLNEYNKNTLFFASGDLSHIGMKFGDNLDSNDLKNDIMNYDLGIIEKINKKNPNELFDYLRIEHSFRKVCGTFPFYAMMDLTKPIKSNNLYYNLWYEEQTKSTVSICSTGMKSNLP